MVGKDDTDHRHVDSHRLEGIQLFHTLVSEISTRLVQDVVPVLVQLAQGVLDAVVHHGGHGIGHKGPDYRFIARQSVIRTELVGPLATKLGTELVYVACLKIDGFSLQILSNVTLWVVRVQTLTISSQNAPNEGTFAKDNSSHRCDHMVSSRREILRWWKAGDAYQGELAEGIELPVLSNLKRWEKECEYHG